MKLIANVIFVLLMACWNKHCSRRVSKQASSGWFESDGLLIIDNHADIEDGIFSRFILVMDIMVLLMLLMVLL